MLNIIPYTESSGGFFSIPEWLEILKYYILIKNDNILLGLIIVATSSKKI